VIDAQTCVASIRISKIIPESIDAFARMKCSNRVCPTLLEQPMIGRSSLRSEQCIVYPSFGFVDVYVGGHHVVIAGEDDRGISTHEFGGVDGQTLEPPQLVIKLWSGRRIAVGKIKTSDNEGTDTCFYVATVEVIGVAQQPPLRFDRVPSSRKNSHTVIAFLSVPNHAVTRFADRPFWKFVLRRLELLETGDVGLRLTQPAQQDWKASIDAIHIVGGDPQLVVSALVRLEFIEIAISIFERLRQTFEVLGSENILSGWGLVFWGSSVFLGLI
jgi:hypothetical protein